MKLEIDIPSIIYNDAKENRGYISAGKMEIAWKAIADGKPLEQEAILDKIKAEMTEEVISHSGTGEEVIQAYADGLKKGLEILDKYKAESEEWVNFADDLIPIIDEAESEET